MERTLGVVSLGSRKALRGPKRLLALRSDAQLVERVRAGDDNAFEVLYDRYAAAILGFCRHMLGSQEEAEDAVQQAFVAAHGALCRGDAEIAFKPWLYAIARNRCLSTLRARREQPVELPELATAGLNEQVEQRADLRQLVADVQRLPERQRAALLLSELDDLSHAEVAEVIGVEARKVKGLVFRARATLAERQSARAADCGEIRVELAAAKGGALRRGRLRYHLESCPACAAYLEEVRRQRQLLGIALPVVPTLALRDGVMAKAGVGVAQVGAVGAAATGGGGAGMGAAGAGAGAAGGAAAATAGTTALGGAAVKLAVAGAILAGGAGVATEVARDGGDRPPDPPAPAADPRPVDAPSGSVGQPARVLPAERALERRRASGAERRVDGRQRAAQRGGVRSATGNRGAEALGGSRGLPNGRGNGLGRALGRDRGRAVGLGGQVPAVRGERGGGAPVRGEGGASRGTGGAGRAAPPRGGSPAPRATKPRSAPRAAPEVPPAGAKGKPQPAPDVPE